MPGFSPFKAYLFLVGVYGDHPHHNEGAHLDKGVADYSVWQCCLHRLDAKLARCYATPQRTVGHRFTEILVVECQGVIDWSWNSKRPFAFYCAIINKTLVVRQEREVWARII